MRKFRKIKGSELAESYKKGWELALKSLEKINPNEQWSAVGSISLSSEKHCNTSQG